MFPRLLSIPTPWKPGSCRNCCGGWNSRGSLIDSHAHPPSPNQWKRNSNGCRLRWKGTQRAHHQPLVLQYKDPSRGYPKHPPSSIAKRSRTGRPVGRTRPTGREKKKRNFFRKIFDFLGEKISKKNVFKKSSKNFFFPKIIFRPKNLEIFFPQKKSSQTHPNIISDIFPINPKKIFPYRNAHSAVPAPIFSPRNVHFVN